MSVSLGLIFVCPQLQSTEQIRESQKSHLNSLCRCGSSSFGLFPHSQAIFRSGPCHVLYIGLHKRFCNFGIVTLCRQLFAVAFSALGCCLAVSRKRWKLPLGKKEEAKLITGVREFCSCTFLSLFVVT